MKEKIDTEQKRPLSDRMKDSEEYGEQVREEINGGDIAVTKDDNKLKDIPKKDQDIKYQGGGR